MTKKFTCNAIAVSLWRCSVPLLAAFAVAGAHAVNIDYGNIKSTEEGFRKHWQLSEAEARRYHNYMEVAGKYRHKDANPLTVLSMIADSSEDKAYYAKKAAEYEHQMVMREIETAWLVSEAMSEAYLADAMETFTDKLTGIQTAGYTPAGETKTDWEDGDRWLVILDDQCLNVACVSQFVSSVPAGALQHKITRHAVLRSDKPLDKAALQLLDVAGETEVSRYDPIEHGYLDNLRSNQALHMREDKMLSVIPVVATQTDKTSQTNNNSQGEGQ